MYKEINNFKDLIKFLNADCNFLNYGCSMMEYINNSMQFYIDEFSSTNQFGYSRIPGYVISKIRFYEELEKVRIKVSGFGPWAKYTEKERTVTSRNLVKILFLHKNGRFEIFNEEVHEFVIYCKEIINKLNKWEEDESIKQNEIFNTKKVIEEKIFS